MCVCVCVCVCVSVCVCARVCVWRLRKRWIMLMHPLLPTQGFFMETMRHAGIRTISMDVLMRMHQNANPDLHDVLVADAQRLGNYWQSALEMVRQGI